MIFRFSLYGFLKNQRYFEPFLILAFLQKDLDFTSIGLLAGFREICVNILEVPSGALADSFGRKKTITAGFFSYSVSFIIFGLSSSLLYLYFAMFLFSIGEAFRTGTHKAMIFDYLEQNGRSGEKTEIYGYTRSWSKAGSAVSVLIGAASVFFLRDYSTIFLISAFPCFLNMLNLASYPAALDYSSDDATSIKAVFKNLISSVKFSLTHKPLRKLIFESMNFEGLYKSSKDFVQPVIRNAALALPVLASVTGRQKTAILTGAVFFFMHTLSAAASRNAGRTVRYFKGQEDRAAYFLWIVFLISFILMGSGILANTSWVVLLSFIIAAAVQNIWRPLLIGRCAGLSEKKGMSTVLSIESQAKSLFSAAVLPLLGFLIDRVSAFSSGLSILPVAVFGIIISGFMLFYTRR